MTDADRWRLQGAAWVFFAEGMVSMMYLAFTEPVLAGGLALGVAIALLFWLVSELILSRR